MRPGAFDAMAFVDSHTEGEPTRVVYAGLVAVSEKPAAMLHRELPREHPWLRGAIVDEPRGSAELVAALLFPAIDDSSLGRVLFCNNVGWLPMCVHATIGLARTLVHLGRIRPDDDSTHRLDTPAGSVGFRVRGPATVEVDNVPGHRAQKGLTLTTASGAITGDVVWGGNWFFLVRDCPIPVREPGLERLRSLALDIREAIDEMDLRGDDGARVDHVQLCGPPERDDAHAKNFVLCPGGAHDRSPCGTGTSARVVCLAEDGQLEPGSVWNQEGITGTVFRARYRRDEAGVWPTVEGRAFITARGELLFDAGDELGGRR